MRGTAICDDSATFHDPNIIHLLSGFLFSDLQDSWKVVEQRVDDLRKEAVDQQETTGGRKALENHLQAQKGNWKFAGQKEAFLQRMSAGWV